MCYDASNMIFFLYICTLLMCFILYACLIAIKKCYYILSIINIYKICVVYEYQKYETNFHYDLKIISAYNLKMSDTAICCNYLTFHSIFDIDVNNSKIYSCCIQTYIIYYTLCLVLFCCEYKV